MPAWQSPPIPEMPVREPAHVRCSLRCLYRSLIRPADQASKRLQNPRSCRENGTGPRRLKSAVILLAELQQRLCAGDGFLSPRRLPERSSKFHHPGAQILNRRGHRE